VEDSELKRTPLYDLHVQAGGRMAGFAGYEMPIRYEPGALAEHLFTRASAGLFDISHMGLVEISGPGHRAWLESLLPTDVAGLAPGQMRYSFFTTLDGGVIDDVMVTGRDDRIDLVVNASRKVEDLAHLLASAPVNVSINERTDVAMVALQGPKAAVVLQRVGIELPALFLQGREAQFDGTNIWVSRSGYTGEDGFEIQGAAAGMVDLAAQVLAHSEVEWAGLGARDSLRLEAGLCLYGNDLDETISPIEAGLRWAIPKRRREEGGFAGAERIMHELVQGPPRRRVGLRPTGRAPVRQGAALSLAGRQVGFVSSGGYGPTVEGPIAMGYVESEVVSQSLIADVRGKEIECEIAALPFVPPRYVRGEK